VSPLICEFLVVNYVVGTVKYMVMDDLEVKPLSTSSLVTLLSEFKLKGIGDILRRKWSIWAWMRYDNHPLFYVHYRH
jgi:hypothetical protein